MIIGKAYYYNDSDIVLFKGIDVDTKCICVKGNSFSFNTVNLSFTLEKIRLATPEETHWLEECIKKDTFVPREIAMASFKAQDGATIFSFSDKSTWRYATTQEIMEYDIQGKPVDVTRIGMTPNDNVIPSNVKKWAVKRTADNYKILNNWANNRKDGSYGHSERKGWIHSINYGNGGHSGYGHYYSDDTKHPDHTEITFEQFKSDIMKIPTSAPVQTVNTNSFPVYWHMLVDRTNKFDAELWRWDGNRPNYQLEIGQLVGVPEYGGKGHNPGKSSEIFGKQISHSEFKKYVMTEEERTRLLLIKYPIGSCIVVTQERSDYNGKENYCYKVCSIKATSDDPVVMYSPMNGIGIRTVTFRYATPEETARYEREGQPYDITNLEKQIEVNNGIPKYVKFVGYGAHMKGVIVCTDHPVPAKVNVKLSWKDIKDCGRFTDGSLIGVTKEEYDAYILKNETTVSTTTNPYEGKSLEEMLAICQKMFPIGTKIRPKKESKIWTVEKPLITQLNQFVSYGGFPIIWDDYRKEMKVDLIELPSNAIQAKTANYQLGKHSMSSFHIPNRDASDAEILAYCKAMYPPGTVLQGGYIITQELVWESTGFISHSGIGIVYNRRDHTFAQVISQSMIKENSYGEPLKTLEDLPKKAKMSDVSALVKHQEPVIVHSKKAKRSKLVIINK